MKTSEPKRVTASALLSQVTDWDTHLSYDGANLTAFEYSKFQNDLTRVIRTARDDGAAIALPDDDLLSGYGTMVTGIIRDIAMIKEKTRRVIQAHIDADCGDKTLMDHLKRVFEARERFADRHYSGGAPSFDNLHYMARVFEGNEQKIKTSNKSSVATSAEVRRGVLTPKG